MKKVAYRDHNHRTMPGYILACPECLSERIVAKGVSIHNGQPILFFACQCAVPDGVMVMRRAA